MTRMKQGMRRVEFWILHRHIESIDRRLGNHQTRSDFVRRLIEAEIDGTDGRSGQEGDYRRRRANCDHSGGVTRPIFIGDDGNIHCRDCGQTWSETSDLIEAVIGLKASLRGPAQ